MIVSSNAALALFSTSQEVQGTPEDETGFGQLLTEIENQATILSGQEDGERRALESVVQFLVTMFQSLTPATPLQAGTAPGAGASGLVSGRTAEGAALEAALTPLSARGLETSGIGRLLLRVTPDASPGTGQLSVSDGTSEASASSTTLTTVLQESFSMVTDRLEGPQNVSGLLSLRPTAPAAFGDSALATPEAQFVRLVTSTVAGDRTETGVATDQSLPQAVPASAAEGSQPTIPSLPHATPLGAEINPLPTAAAARSNTTGGVQPPQPAASSEPDVPLPDAGSPVGLTQPHGTPAAAADSVARTAAEQVGQLAVPASPPAVPAAGQASQAPALPDTRPFAAGDEARQARRVLPEASPLAAVAPATAAAHTAVPHLAESLTSAPTIPQGTSSVQEAAEAHRATELPQQAPEATPGLSHLSDGSFIAPRPGGTSPTTAVEPGSTAPPSSHTLEGVDTRQWPRPLPSNTVLLHLEPRELGTLLVQVRVSEKRLIASFRTQSPEVESLLRTHLPALHESLSQRGFEVQPIAVSVAAEGFSAHTGAGSGTFTQQHSTFHAFAQEQPGANTGETRNEAEVSNILPQPAARGDRLLDVLI